MKVLLLLAGKSRRFWPLADKSLFPLCGKPLLAHQIDRLKAAGITDITLVGGAHNLANVRTLFPDLPIVEQENLGLGMRGALLSALPGVGNEPVLIVSGNDVIASEGYRLLLERAASDGVDGTILASRVTKYFPGGYLTLDGDRVKGIIEKPGEGKEPSDLVTIVAHIHKDPQRLLKALQETPAEPDDGYERALAVLFGEKVYHAVPYEGPWHPVKFPWHLLPLLEHLLHDVTAQQIHPSVQIHPTAVIQGNVRLEEGVRVFPHATI
ncbi:MAG: NTP transferase domain-containing protein, partial [Candidatus Peregrinibacteria bacterium]